MRNEDDISELEKAVAASVDKHFLSFSDALEKYDHKGYMRFFYKVKDEVICKRGVYPNNSKVVEVAIINATLIDTVGMTALHIAAKRGHPGIVKWLLNHGADANVQNQDGRVAMHFATSNYREPSTDHDYPEVITLLLEANADLTLKNLSGARPDQILPNSGCP